MKASAERECSKLPAPQQTKCVSMSLSLKQCHIHIVLVQLCIEPGNDFTVKTYNYVLKVVYCVLCIIVLFLLCNEWDGILNKNEMK